VRGGDALSHLPARVIDHRRHPCLDGEAPKDEWWRLSHYLFPEAVVHDEDLENTDAPTVSIDTIQALLPSP